MSRHPVTPADRRLLRLLPLTVLFQRQRGQPAAMFRELPQLQRLLRAGLIRAAYDASANAITLNRSTDAEARLAGEAAPPPIAPGLQDALG